MVVMVADYGKKYWLLAYEMVIFWGTTLATGQRNWMIRYADLRG